MEAGGAARRSVEGIRRGRAAPASLGLRQKDISKRMLKQIYGRVKKAGEGMNRLPPDQSKPTAQQIDAALEAFTVRQWTPVERWPPRAVPSYEGLARQGV